MYQALAASIAEDPALLHVAAKSRRGPVPNLFLASVHDLLLQGKGRELSAYYPTISGSRSLQPSGAPAVFKQFVLSSEEKMLPALQNRRVQTNEVRRAAVLRLALGWLREYRDVDRAALVEVGTSAGLLLALDSYGYRYGSATADREDSSGLMLQTELRGRRDIVNLVLPEIAERIGIDLTVLNPRIESDRRWLRALIWGDQPERLARLDRAIDIAVQAPIRLVEGDANTLLPETLRSLPDGLSAIVFHSHALNQFSAADRQRFDSQLRDGSGIRPVYRIAMEGAQTHSACIVSEYRDGALLNSEMLARYDAHVEWIDWLA